MRKKLLHFNNIPSGHGRSHVGYSAAFVMLEYRHNAKQALEKTMRTEAYTLNRSCEEFYETAREIDQTRLFFSYKHNSIFIASLSHYHVELRFHG